MLQLLQSDRQVYWLLRCILYSRFDGTFHWYLCFFLSPVWLLYAPFSVSGYKITCALLLLNHLMALVLSKGTVSGLEWKRMEIHTRHINPPCIVTREIRTYISDQSIIRWLCQLYPKTDWQSWCIRVCVSYVEVAMMCHSNWSLSGTPESLHMGTHFAKCP